MVIPTETLFTIINQYFMNITDHPACHYLLPMLVHPIHKDLMRDFS